MVVTFRFYVETYRFFVRNHLGRPISDSGHHHITNEKLRPPVIREVSGQTPRETFHRLEFWNAVRPGHLIETLCQMWYLQHTGTGFIGNAYLLRFYGPIKVITAHQPRAGTITRQ